MADQAYNKISRIFDDGENAPEVAKETGAIEKTEKEDWTSDYEGQLAVDVYQTDTDIKIIAPIAGVKPEDLDIAITGNNLVIRGARKTESEVKKEHFIVQECYWGSFTRTIELSKGLDTEKATANLKNGVLTVTIPKQPKAQTKVLKIETD